MIKAFLDPPICKSCHMSTNVVLIHYPESGHIMWYCELCNKDLTASLSLQDEPTKQSDMLQMQEQQVCKTEEKI